MKPFLCFRDFKRAIHAFISSRLSFCNSLYSGVSLSSVSRLQLVKNAAARLLSGTCKLDHLSPILASLHWLPVSFQIDFKILLFIFKALDRLAPSYLSDLLNWYTPARWLRSADQMLLAVPRSRLKHRGDPCFHATACKLWNKLPLHFRTSPLLETFKTHLKTHFYSLAFNSELVCITFICLISYSNLLILCFFFLNFYHIFLCFISFVLNVQHLGQQLLF